MRPERAGASAEPREFFLSGLSPADLRGREPLTGEAWDVDWETAGQVILRSEVAILAERWGWSKRDCLGLPVRERNAYAERAAAFAKREAGHEK